MRVYLPATTVTLRALADSGGIGPSPLTGFAVTPALREWYLDDDVEALEYAAMSEAARASLRLVDADGSAARRRVVIAVEVPPAAVEVRDDLDRGVVRLADDVPLRDVVSVHADDLDAENTIAAAAQAMIAADLGDAGAQDVVDDAEGHELSWYANQEIEQFLSTL